jgi:hypothetical protein
MTTRNKLRNAALAELLDTERTAHADAEDQDVNAD